MSLNSCFTLFPNLPHELQTKIWRSALPPSSYKSLAFRDAHGCWVPRSLGPDEEDYYARNRGPDVEIVYKPQRLKSPELDLRGLDIRLLMQTNHDARAVALSWLRANSFTHHHGTVWRRSFNLETDALFLNNLDMLGVLTERWDRMRQARIEDITIECHDFVKSILLSIGSLRNDREDHAIMALATDLKSLQTILVVSRDPHFGEDWVWWEYSRAPGGVFRWNYEDRRFDFVGVRSPALENAYTAIEQALLRLAPDLAWINLKQMEVVPCFATNRLKR